MGFPEKNFDFTVIDLPGQCIDLLSKSGSAVGHCHKNSLDAQSRVDLLPHFADGLQQLLQALDG